MATSGYIPTILLIGAGRFGREHLKEWKALEKKGCIKIYGVVVTSRSSSDAVSEEFGVHAYHQLTRQLLEQVDGVDIATPANTHAELIRKCLPYAHVLVEKPLAKNSRQLSTLVPFIQKSRHRLMVGHIYRFHPLVNELKHQIALTNEKIQAIKGAMINPERADSEKLDINLEFLHVFDIVDDLLNKTANAFRTTQLGSINHVDIQYQGRVKATYQIGWHGNSRKRNIELYFPNKIIIANFSDNALVIKEHGRMNKIFLSEKPCSLVRELKCFLDIIKTNTAPEIDYKVGSRIVKIAEKAKPKPGSKKPRVAIVGGGIFGVTAALEIGKFCDVTLFERHGELLTEASFLNQWRHHSGFHYPRSVETIQEIQATKQDFEEVYGGVVVNDFPSFFCTSSSGVEITREHYLATCRSNKLNFQQKMPPGSVLDHNRVSLCLETDEAVINIVKMRKMVAAQLDRNQSIKLLRNAKISSGKITEDGQKLLRYTCNSKLKQEKFDFVINATYANSNQISRWLGFPLRPLRFDLLELAVLRIPIPKISVTILDGPFTSLVSMGTDNMFMLSHINESLLKSEVTKNGLPPKWSSFKSNYRNLHKHCRRYLPILDEAEYIESRYGLRTVNAYSEDFDGRPTVVTRHGFGCYSVLGGKIITSVSNAREIAESIAVESGINRQPG